MPGQRGKSGHIQTMEPRRSIGFSQTGQVGRSRLRAGRAGRGRSRAEIRFNQPRGSLDTRASLDVKRPGGSAQPVRFGFPSHLVTLRRGQSWLK